MHAYSSKDLSSLENSIGHKFKKKSLLKEAITHKSFAHEQQNPDYLYNERMEFLGDSVLELIVSEYLYCSYTEFTEADLSKIKAYAVQESTLAEFAQSINLGSSLLLGKGEEITGGREKPSLLANAIEAVIAAIHLDGGFNKSKEFVLNYLIPKIDKLTADNVVFDFKTELQEIAQAEFGVLPEYVTHKEEGPEHRKIFEVKVFINNDLFGTGQGRTKKAAAQKAAEAGLNSFREE